MAELYGANAVLGCPSPPIALGDWLTGATYFFLKNKKKGSSPPTAIWAIGLEGEKKTPPPITIE